MIKKNYKDVHFINKGTQVIDKVYKGTDLVFEQGYTREQTGVPPITTTYQAIGKNLKDYKIYGNSIQGHLPSEYQQVEYIESTGTQYIDTGFKPNQNSSVELEGYITDTNANSLFGSNPYFVITSGSTNNYCFRFRRNNNTIDSNTSMKIKSKLSILKNNIYINDNLSGTFENSSFSSPYNSLIFARNNSSGNPEELCKCRIYYVKIWNDTTLIRNFIPCYRKSDNVIGMYDLVTNTFFTNAGTGVFLKGSNAPTPTTPIEIESVGDLITDTNDINYGKYKIPVKVKDTNNIVQSTINIYLDEPLRKVGNYADYIDFKNQKVFRNVIVNDDTGTQTTENSYTGTTDSSGTSISLPNIPTIKGTTIFEIDTEIQPSNMYIKYKGK